MRSHCLSTSRSSRPRGCLMSTTWVPLSPIPIEFDTWRTNRENDLTWPSTKGQTSTWKPPNCPVWWEEDLLKKRSNLWIPNLMVKIRWIWPRKSWLFGLFFDFLIGVGGISRLNRVLRYHWILLESWERGRIPFLLLSFVDGIKKKCVRNYFVDFEICILIW